jgi:hypothetical protein
MNSENKFWREIGRRKDRQDGSRDQGVLGDRSSQLTCKSNTISKNFAFRLL